MGDFNKQVYDLVLKIPEGKVATYGQIALLLGRRKGARAVGWAMRATPEYLKIPAHRVVNRLGEMAPEYVFGSKQIQRQLLEEEGIVFRDNGCIDMKKYLWRGPDNLL